MADLERWAENERNPWDDCFEGPLVGDISFGTVWRTTLGEPCQLDPGKGGHQLRSAVGVARPRHDPLEDLLEKAEK